MIPFVVKVLSELIKGGHTVGHSDFRERMKRPTLSIQCTLGR